MPSDQIIDMKRVSPRKKGRTARLRVVFAIPALLIAVLGSAVAGFYMWTEYRSSGPAAPRPAIARLAPPNSSGASHPLRPVYPLSILPGGAYSPTELRKKLQFDKVAARHFQSFHLDNMSSARANFGSPVYVSYRRDDKIFWTRKAVWIKNGETILTDGAQFARARCGNRISTTPMSPVATSDPPASVLDQPTSSELPLVAELAEQPVESWERAVTPVGAIPPAPTQHFAPKPSKWLLPLLPLPFLGGLQGGGGSGHHNPDPGSQAAPEIDPASGVNAIALISGALLLLRSRRRK
jgi:hypothetical protein